MPGERVTFEIGYEGRRMVARTQFANFWECLPCFAMLFAYDIIMYQSCMIFRVHSGRNVRPFGEDKHTQAVRAYAALTCHCQHKIHSLGTSWDILDTVHHLSSTTRCLSCRSVRWLELAFTWPNLLELQFQSIAYVCESSMYIDATPCASTPSIT